MTLYSIMSCSGFDTSFMGGCSMAWIGMAILFFVVVFLGKAITEAAGYDFNYMFAYIGAYLPYIIVITLTGSAKFSFLAGILGVVVGGVVLAQFGFGGE